MTDATAPQTAADHIRDALLSRYLAIKEAQDALKAEMDAIKAQLSDGAFAHFGVTGDKKYAPGVQVRELTEVNINTEEALKWVMEDAFGRSAYLTVKTDNMPVLVGFLLSQPMFHGMLTLKGSALTDKIKDAFKAGEKAEGIPYERLEVQISKSLQLAITDKDTGLAPSGFPRVILSDNDPNIPAYVHYLGDPSER